MTEAIKTIPYGVSDFANLRNGNGYYVDRTSLIPNLEEHHYQLFLRPRRFGKSLLLSMLGYYYDINAQDRFDTLFAGTWIHDHPTDRRGKYMVMKFGTSVGEAGARTMLWHHLLRSERYCWAAC